MADHQATIVIKGKDEASNVFKNIEKSFTRIGTAVLGAKGIEIGMTAIAAAAYAWKFEQAKINGSFTETLEAELKMNEGMRELAGTIPMIGSGIVKMMKAFGDDEGLRNTIQFVKELEQSTANIAKLAKQWQTEAKIEGLQAAGAPASLINYEQGLLEQEKRDAEIGELQKKLDEARLKYEAQIEDENESARLVTPSTMYGPLPKTTPDRRVSNQLKNDLDATQKKIDEAQEANRQKINARGVAVESKRQEEQAKNKEQQEKLQHDFLGTDKKRIEEEQAQQKAIEDKQKEKAQKAQEFKFQQLHELHQKQLDLIENEWIRKKEQINLEYEEKFRKAKQAGLDIGILEQQKAVDMDIISMQQEQKQTQNKDISRSGIEGMPGISRFMPGWAYAGKNDTPEKQLDALHKIHEELQKQTKAVPNANTTPPGFIQGGYKIAGFN